MTAEVKSMLFTAPRLPSSDKSEPKARISSGLSGCECGVVEWASGGSLGLTLCGCRSLRREDARSRLPGEWARQGGWCRGRGAGPLPDAGSAEGGFRGVGRVPAIWIVALGRVGGRRVPCTARREAQPLEGRRPSLEGRGRRISNYGGRENAETETETETEREPTIDIVVDGGAFGAHCGGGHIFGSSAVPGPATVAAEGRRIFGNGWLWRG